ncbi:MAG: photosynthetic complex putative assembly protein PuhB [Pseudomonadota bacterium]
MDHDDFQPPEPIEGLPEVPPEGEHILWQGRPDWWQLAKDALLVKWVVVYFGFLAIWRGLAGWLSVDANRGIAAALWLIGIGLMAAGLLALIAWIQARATMYTITNRRIVMRVGAALTLALNLPYKWIASADLQVRKNGTGTIALDLLGETRFSYIVCWPHVRPWHMTKTQPALRSIANAEDVARLIAENATAVTRSTETTAIAETAPDPAGIAAE